MTRKRNNYGGLSFSLPRLPLNPEIWKQGSQKGLVGITSDDPNNTAFCTKAELEELRRAAIEAHESDLAIIDNLIQQAPERRLTRSENAKRQGLRNTGKKYKPRK